MLRVASLEEVLERYHGRGTLASAIVATLRTGWSPEAVHERKEYTGSLVNPFAPEGRSAGPASSGRDVRVRRDARSTS